MAREVRELMRVQHKSMFDALRAGALDDLLDDTANNAGPPEVSQASAPHKATPQENAPSPVAPMRSHTSSTSHAAAAVTPAPASFANPARTPVSDAPESAYDSIASPILSVGQAPPEPAVRRATASTSHPASSVAAPRQPSTFEADYKSSTNVSDSISTKASTSVPDRTSGSWSRKMEERDFSRPYLRDNHQGPVARAVASSTTDRRAVDQFNPSETSSKPSLSSHYRQPRVPRPQPNRVPRPAGRSASFFDTTSSFRPKDSSFGPSDVSRQSLDEVIRGFLAEELGGDDATSTRDGASSVDADTANRSTTNRDRTKR